MIKINKIPYIKPDVLEHERKRWASIAKENGWYSEPFFVQAWVNEDGTCDDSVSFMGMKKDIILPR